VRKVNKKKKKQSTELKDKINIIKKKDDEIKEKDTTSVKKKNSSIKNNSKKQSKPVLNENKTKFSFTKLFSKKKKTPLKKNDSKEENKKKNKKQTVVTKKTKKKKRSIWKKLLTFLLILGITGVLLVASFFGYIVLSSPEFDESAFEVKEQTVVYDIKGEIIAKLGSQNREIVTYDELPQVLIDAIIATEDSRYFQHNGVDLPRFIKASIYQLMGRSDAGGASTLTMQMVKNGLTSNEDEGIAGIIRKFQDVYLSVFKVEKNYTKEEIIELYVNYHCLGSSIYGVGEASKYYFGKSVSELTLPEASLLAGLFQAPNRHNPYKYPESATSRRNTVLKLMVRHGYITQEEADIANSIDVNSLLVGIKAENNYQAYIDYVTTQVIELTGKDPVITPMKIYTTMEKSIQDGINKVINNNEASYWKDDLVQAGIAVVNVNTGAVAAVSGQRNNNDAKIFSYATGAKKQPGSTAKPIFAYGPGFEYLNNSTYNIYVDEPWSYTSGPSINNWDGKFHGIVTTRYALQYSRNIPALKAYQQVGSKKIQQFAYNLGLNVSYNQNSENYKILNERTGLDNTINEAYSIGGTAEGFSPLEMASAYSAFASGGYYTKAYAVTKIEFRDTGETIEYKPTKKRVMKDSTAYLMNNILESAVTSGFNGGANVSGSHVAAKTGTTNYDEATIKKYKLPSNAVNDLWTVAYTSDYSIAVWYGYDNVSIGYNVSGKNYKENLVRNVMKYIPKDTVGWKKPSSVVAVQVEKETYPAKLPSEYTPENMITTEYFVRGTQPTEVSNRYAQLNNINNYKVSTNGNTALITWEYTVPEVLTDEYLNTFFNQKVFGKSQEKLIEERKKYNLEKLGDIVFGIYKENLDGTLQLITYVNQNSYTYTGTENVSIIIKAEHTIFKTNASSGIKLNLNLTNESPTPTPTPPTTPSTPAESLTVTLNGRVDMDAPVGNYVEEGVKSVLYGVTDVTNNAVIKYQITIDNNIHSFTTKELLQQKINTLPTGKYEITYIVTYNNKKFNKYRNLTLK